MSDIIYGSNDEEAKLSVLSGEFQLVFGPETLITDHQWRKILESSLFSFLYLPKYITLSRD